METRCPNPDCNHQFELSDVEPNKRKHYLSVCPICGIEASFRSIEALGAIDKAYSKKLEKGSLSGGPALPSDMVPALSVLVEDVRSLWNVGSIYRTADGAGFERIYLSGITGSPPRKEIEKVSLGAENTVNWSYQLNPLSVIKSLEDKNVEIVGLEVASNSVPLLDALKEGALSTPLCLVVGNEVSGISPQVLNRCSRVCHLPMYGMKESLNVAVAFGIAAYAIKQYCS